MAPNTCRGTLRWKPQEQDMKQHNSKCSSVRNLGYQTSRRKETSQKCCWQHGHMHNTNSRLCPNESVRLSSSLVCCNKGLNVWCGRQWFASSKQVAMEDVSMVKIGPGSIVH